MSEVCEAIDSKLDPTATSDLSQAALAKLVWILTRVKPCTPVSRFRVKTYAALNARFRMQHNKILEQHEAMGQTVAALRREPLLSDDFVTAMAANEGFNDEWMTISETRPKTNPKAPHVPDPNQMQLPDMLAVVPKLPPPALPAASKAAAMVPPPARAALGKAAPVAPLAPLATASVAAPPGANPLLQAAVAAGPPAAAAGAPPPTPIPVPTAPDAAAAENGDSNGDGMAAAAAAESLVPEVGRAVDAVNSGQSRAGDLCVICYQPLAASWCNGELMALTCGHVFHSVCLEKTWNIGQHPRGWCPFKCPVEHDDPDFVDLGNMEAASSSRDGVEAAAAAAADMVL